MNVTTGNHFTILFEGLEGDAKTDTAFQSITGLQVYAAGGNENMSTAIENEKLHYTPLFLTRAVQDPKASTLSRWMFEYFNGQSPRLLPAARIIILNEYQQPLMSWRITNLRPVSWKLGELHAEKNEVLTEVIGLAYENLSVYNAS